MIRCDVCAHVRCTVLCCLAVLHAQDKDAQLANLRSQLLAAEQALQEARDNANTDLAAYAVFPCLSKIIVCMECVYLFGCWAL